MARKIEIVLFALLLSLFSSNAQQKVTITGSVKDKDGVGLDAATVVLKTGKVGVITNPNGTYSITISSSDISSALVFSYLGKVDKVVAIGSKRVIDVVLEDSEFVLEEAVVQTGYGVAQKRSDLTGSAFQVNSESLQALPKARMDNILAGMVPGVSITNDNSNGRSTVKVRVRGDASLSASSEPLWIVDGVPIYTGSITGQVVGTSYTVSPFSLINPDDIESMTVLKDAATTTIYGADGANGVILVTTKSGSYGKTRINASIRQGISHTDRSTLRRMCSAEQWWELAREGWIASGRPIEAFPYQDSEHNSYSTTDTDWYGVYYGVGLNTQLNFSASGGTERLSNYLSANYYDDKSSAKGNNQTRFSIRNKSTYNFGKKLSITIGINGTYNDNDILSITSSAYKVLPIFSPYDEDGFTPRLYNYISTSDTEYAPQMRKFVYSNVPDREYNDNNQKTVTADINGQIVWKPIKGLSISSQVGYNTMGIYEAIYDSGQTLDGIYSDGLVGYSRRGAVFSYTMNNVNRLNYSNTFGKHSVTFMGAVELTDKKYHYLNVSGHGFINDAIKELAYVQSDTIDGTSNTTYSRSLSYLAQASYSFDRRYYITASWRRQGNSSFSTFARWGNFASVGLSYNMHNESWFNVPWIDTFKLKASYGNNGNSRLDTSSAYGTYTYSDGSYYGGVMGAHQNTPPNPGLSWETTHIQNYGISLGFLRRFEVDVEAYDKLTDNLLYSGRVSSVITSSSVTRNVGQIDNKGIEVSLSARLIKNGDWSWNMSINGFRNKNIIKKLYKGMRTGFFDYVWMEGASKNAWWLVRWAGVDPVDGSPMWYDKNGNLTHTFSFDDRVLLPEYDKQPKLEGGMNHTIAWKDLTLNLLFNYTIGGWDQMNIYTDGHDIIGFNVAVEEMDHWRNPGDLSVNPRFVYKEQNYSASYSTRNLVKKTNVMLRNVSLNYNIPKKISKKLNVDNAAIHLIVDNAYLWTPGQSATHNSYKTTLFSSGMSRTYSAELSFSF